LVVATPPALRAAGRRKSAKAGDALPDGSFPIPNVSYLHKALKAVGRAGPGKRPAVAALIRKRARQLGRWNVVKGSWADNTQGAKAMAQAMKNALELAGGSGGPFGSMAPAPTVNDYQQQVTKLTGVGAKVYRRLRSKGMPHHQALPLARKAHKIANRRDTAGGQRGDGSSPGGAPGRRPGGIVQAGGNSKRTSSSAAAGSGHGAENVGTLKGPSVGFDKQTGGAGRFKDTRGGSPLARAYQANTRPPGDMPTPKFGKGEVRKSGQTGYGRTTGRQAAVVAKPKSGRQRGGVRQGGSSNRGQQN